MGQAISPTLLSYLDTHGLVVLNEILTIRVLTFAIVRGKDITFILSN